MKKKIMTLTGIALFTLAFLSPEENVQLGCKSYFRLDKEKENKIYSGGTAILQPSLEIAHNPFSIVFIPKLSLVSGEKPSLEFNSWYTEFAPKKHLSVRAGLFTPDDSCSLTLPGIEWFASPVSGETLFDGHALSDIPENLIKATIGTQNWYVSGYLSPYAPRFRNTDDENPLFETAKIKQSYTNVWGDIKTLSGVETPDDTSSFSIDPSWGVRGGFDTGSIFCSLLGFYGIDRAAPLEHMMMQSLSSDTYKLYTRRVTAKIKSTGIIAGYATEFFSAHFEGSLTENRTLLASDMYATTLQGNWQTTETVTQTAYVTGLTLTPPELPFFGTRLSGGGEIRNAYYTNKTELETYPFMHRALFAFFEANGISFLPVRIRIEYMRSLSDGSALFSPSVNIELGRGQALELKARIPEGGETTELGQFGKNDRESFSILFSILQK